MPLSYAARSGHKEAVKTLLKRNDIGPGMADKLGIIPLPWAALNRCGRILRKLPERNDVNPPQNGRYIFSRIVWDGHNVYFRTDAWTGGHGAMQMKGLHHAGSLCWLYMSVISPFLSLLQLTLIARGCWPPEWDIMNLRVPISHKV